MTSQAIRSAVARVIPQWAMRSGIWVVRVSISSRVARGKISVMAVEGDEPQRPGGRNRGVRPKSGCRNLPRSTPSQHTGSQVPLCMRYLTRRGKNSVLVTDENYHMGGRG